MESFDSTCLIRLIKQASTKPADKLLAVYSLLNIWLQAPAVRQGITQEHVRNALLLQNCPVLTAYLVSLATEAKLQHPAIVVNQMMILLRGAIAEELRNPESRALQAAQQAASAVVKQARPSMMARVDKAIRASGYAAACLASTILAVHFWPTNNLPPLHHAQPDAGYAKVAAISSIEPELLLKAFTLKKSMEAGTCPTPNFFSIPKEQIPIYMDVVHSRLSNNPNINNQRLTVFLTWYEQQRAWECYPKAQINQRFISRI